jgi:hypothetical protein
MQEARVFSQMDTQDVQFCSHASMGAEVFDAPRVEDSALDVVADCPLVWFIEMTPGSSRCLVEAGRDGCGERDCSV